MEKMEEKTRLVPNASESTTNNYGLVRQNAKTELDHSSKFEIGSHSGSDDEPKQPFSQQLNTIKVWFSGLLKRKGSKFGAEKTKPPVVHPKVYFANERTFLAWLHMSVTIASLSIAVVAFAEANSVSRVYGLAMILVAICFCVYSLFQFKRRTGMLTRMEGGPYDEFKGPIALACCIGLAVFFNFCSGLYNFKY